MPEIRINISEKRLALLETLKNEYGLSSRSEALEAIFEQLFIPDEETKEFKSEE